MTNLRTTGQLHETGTRIGSTQTVLRTYTDIHPEAVLVRSVEAEVNALTRGTRAQVELLPLSWRKRLANTTGA